MELQTELRSFSVQRNLRAKVWTPKANLTRDGLKPFLMVSIRIKDSRPLLSLSLI